MFPRNRMIRTVNTTFKLCPKSINRIGMDNAINVLFFTMLDGLVQVTKVIKLIEVVTFIRGYGLTVFNVIKDDRQYCIGLTIRDNFSPNLTATLNDTKYRSFAFCTPATLA